VQSTEIAVRCSLDLGGDAEHDGCVTASRILGSLTVRTAFVAACVASPVFTLLHDVQVGAACGIAGSAGLITGSARESPHALRQPVSALVFWLAVGVMAFLGVYVVAARA
jgi:hypothetical protein